jgi:hypothetical protein
MSDLKKFDVRYAYNGLIVVAGVVLVVALHEKNVAVEILAIGFIGLGFGVWAHHSPNTYIDHQRGTKYTTIDYEPKTLGWVIIAISACVILFGAFRLVFSPLP